MKKLLFLYDASNDGISIGIYTIPSLRFLPKVGTACFCFETVMITFSLGCRRSMPPLNYCGVFNSTFVAEMCGIVTMSLQYSMPEELPAKKLVQGLITEQPKQEQGSILSS
jgi:hypothetical protein